MTDSLDFQFLVFCELCLALVLIWGLTARRGRDGEED